MEAGVGVPSPELGRNRFLSLQDPLWADPACTGIPAAGDRTLHQSGSVESDDSSRHARQLSHRCVTWIRQGTRLLPSIFVQQRRFGRKIGVAHATVSGMEAPSRQYCTMNALSGWCGPVIVCDTFGFYQ